MRVLALDVGERRIGVALSDPLGLTAQRLTVVDRRGTVQDIEQIRTLVTRHHVETIVVGHPLTMRGEQGIQAQRVAAFAQRLRDQLSMTVQLVDERLTTVQGERSLRETQTSARNRKRVIDQVAAQLILQHFLDAKRPTTP